MWRGYRGKSGSKRRLPIFFLYGQCCGRKLNIKWSFLKSDDSFNHNNIGKFKKTTRDNFFLIKYIFFDRYLML